MEIRKSIVSVEEVVTDGGKPLASPIHSMTSRRCSTPTSKIGGDVHEALYGAMGVRGVARPEAEIARRVREVVGRDAFIVGTFDLQGNEDAEFLRQADPAFCAKYFPHYDSRMQGERAARTLIRFSRRRLHTCHRDGEDADPDRDGDRSLAVDGFGAARTPRACRQRSRPC